MVRRPPRWLTKSIVLALQRAQLAEHGGSPGLRDPALLESALARPEQKLAYAPESDLATIAAAYGFGLAKNHAFVDGNKRAAFTAMLMIGWLSAICASGLGEEVGLRQRTKRAF